MDIGIDPELNTVTTMEPEASRGEEFALFSDLLTSHVLAMGKEGSKYGENCQRLKWKAP